MKVCLISLFLIIASVSFGQNSMHDICPLKVGSDIPAVSIMDKNSNKVDLNALTTDTSTILIFYRGAWCGYCTKHLAELNDIKEDVENLGYSMIGITMDQPSKLDESNIKSESEIQVYSDASADAITAFGLDWKLSDETFSKYKNEYKLDLEEWSGEDHHSLPVPAIYIIKDNIVQFQYVNPNYNTRLNPETLLSILKTL